MWDENGCSKQNPEVCVYKGCPCTSPNQMQGTQQCNACASGFILYNGYCYVGAAPVYASGLSSHASRL
jgi:hypothetical protein